MILRSVIAFASLLTAFLFARFYLATTIRPYDDEGYFLLSLGHYLKGETLYGQLFSQYGPFYFYAQEALFRLLQLPVNHDAGRIVTLIWWMVSAALGGYFVYGISRNIALAAAATLACAKVASVLAHEPGHPQQLILPVFFGACCLSMSAGWRGWLGPFVIGALGAALCLTKINVGVFYFAGLAYVLVCLFPPSSRIRSVGMFLVLVYAVGFPLFLMRTNLIGSALGYCLLAILCGVSTFVTGSLVMPSSARPMRHVLYAVWGALAATCLVVMGTLLQDMSLSTLMDGVVRGPLKHPGLYSKPVRILPWDALAAVSASGFVAALYWFREREWVQSDLIEAVRFVVGLCAIPMLALFPGRIIWVLPLVPFGLLPVNGQDWRMLDFVPRLFVASLAVTQFLQAYPVAGSQVAIAAAPVMLWAFVCVHDGAAGFFRLIRRMTGAGNYILKESVAGALLAMVIVTIMFRSVSWAQWSGNPPSRLEGSTSLHLRADEEDRYQFLSTTIRANCDMLFTLPGMGSLNFWSGVPTPNGSNLTIWMKGLSPERQQGILEVLKANPRACSVYNPKVVQFWEVTPAELEALPLAAYVIHDMRKVAERDDYEIRVHPARSTPWRTDANP